MDGQPSARLYVPSFWVFPGEQVTLTGLGTFPQWVTGYVS